MACSKKVRDAIIKLLSASKKGKKAYVIALFFLKLSDQAQKWSNHELDIVYVCYPYQV